MNQLFPVILIVISVTFYNIFQKSTPTMANPYASLIIAYGVALAVTVVLFFFNGTEKGPVHEFGTTNWTSFALGVTIVGIELGYLFLYRAGWNISVGSLIVNIMIAVALIGVGVLFYKETISLTQVLGIGLCVGGLILINKK